MDAARSFISPLLVGRDDLLELAARRLDEAAEGRGQLLLIAGEAGIGKSRLLGAICDTALSRRFRVVGGYVAPQDRDVPAASLLDLARNAQRQPEFGDVGTELLGLREAAAVAQRARRRMLVVDIVELIRGLLDRPTALVFEDLQWADDLSLEIIAELARTTRDQPLAMVGTYRLDEAPPGTSLRDWRSRLLTQRVAEEMRLGPLDLAQTALVTTLILDTGLPAPREVVAAVYERTDGIPLHIEELLGAMSAQARADGRAIREATVPETIEDAVLERLGHRSPEAQAVARAGAVIGRCFVPDVLAGIMDVPPESLDEPLQELMENGVIDPPGARGLIDFRHQLLRDAIYRSIALRDLRRFHARAGEFGAQLEGHSEIHASLHFERAGLRRQAFESALAGARHSAGLSAHREAFELFQRAVDNLPADLSDADRAEIFEALADAAAAIEEQPVAERYYREAVEAYRRAGDVTKAIVSSAGILGIWRRDARPVSERVELGSRLLAELEGLPEDPDVHDARATVGCELARAYAEAHALVDARATIDMAKAEALAGGDPEMILGVEWFDCYVRFTEGDRDRSLIRLGEIAIEAERARFESAAVSSMRDLGTLATQMLAYGEASRWIANGLRYADSIEQSHCAHVMTATSALVDWAGGDWDASTDMAHRALTDRGCRRAATTARWALGYLALGRGDLAAASAELTAAVEFGEASEALGLLLPPSWGLAETALLLGEPDRASAHCHQALHQVMAVGERPLLVPFVVTGVRAELATGRPAAAVTWLDECAAHLTSGSEPLPVADVALAHGRGLLALSNGSTTAARTLLDEAARGWESHGRVWEANWARLDLAGSHIRAGRFADGARIAAEVRSTASRLDSAPLAARAEAVLRMARGHVSMNQPWYPLTAREFEVARLISEGSTNAEIAGALGISPKTASAHVEHILAKLGASRRTEIATWTSQVAGVTDRVGVTEVAETVAPG